MKKLILIGIFTLNLSGCALWDIYNQSKYDTNEYALVTKVRTLAQTSKGCDEVSVKNLYFTTLELKNFSEHMDGNNEKSIKMNENLVKMSKELYERQQPVPVVYCNAKLNLIEISAERIQQVTGTKPR